MPLRKLCVFLMVLLIVLLACGVAYSKSVVSLRWLNKKVSIGYFKSGKVIYLPFQKLTDLYGGKYKYSKADKTLLSFIGKHKIQVQAGNVIVYVDRNIYSLNQKPVYKDGELWVPIDMLKILGRVFYKIQQVTQKEEVKPQQPEKPQEQKSPETPSGFCGVVGIRSSTHDAFTRIVVELDKLPSFSSSFDRDIDAVNVVLSNVHLNKAISKDVSDGFVKSVRIYVKNDKVYLSVYLVSALPFKVFSLSKPPRVVVDVQHKRSPVEVKSEVSSGTKPSEKRFVPSKRPLIVIDPGHGGKDPGAIGPTGVKEKDITLKVGLLLRKYLLSMGYRVAMTRDKDVFVSLRGRTRIAQKLHADLFISLHCNAAFSRKASGAEVYYMSLPSSRSAMETAIRENKSLGVSGKETKRRMNLLSIILADMRRNAKLNTSARLAEILQKQIKRVKWVYSRKVAQAPFVVLEGFDAIPAVLVEMAFISNPREEKLLSNYTFQKMMARNIAIGIKRFFSLYRGGR